MTTLIIIILSVLLCLSIFANFVSYKRLVEFEDNNQAREDAILEKIESFKSKLKERLEVIETVAGHEVVSNEPFVKQVVQAIVETHECFIDLQRQLEYFELELEEEESKDEEQE